RHLARHRGRRGPRLAAMGGRRRRARGRAPAPASAVDDDRARRSARRRGAPRSGGPPNAAGRPASRSGSGPRRRSAPAPPRRERAGGGGAASGPVYSVRIWQDCPLAGAPVGPAWSVGVLRQPGVALGAAPDVVERLLTLAKDPIKTHMNDYLSQLPGPPLSA